MFDPEVFEVRHIKGIITSPVIRINNAIRYNFLLNNLYQSLGSKGSGYQSGLYFYPTTANFSLLRSRLAVDRVNKTFQCPSMSETYKLRLRVGDEKKGLSEN